MNTEPAPSPAWLADVCFDAQGLVPAIATDAESGTVLMMAWMNAEALVRTARDGLATYYSRSRARLWVKGEQSGHRQYVEELRLDCDGDCIVMRVRQEGGIACHTGRAHCFYRVLRDDAWEVVEPVLRDPQAIYADTSAPRES